ncbi:hypothetical protein ASF78_19195 [Cellulomonas sp. Leaf334]|nr:hypothetical protein ASF78_19195 [Cellulomonas sp. Leaf334]
MAWSVAIVVGPLILVTIVVLAVVLSVRKAAVAKTTDLAPDRSASVRLAEAQDLYRRGLITADEHGEMRQRILGEV